MTTYKGYSLHTSNDNRQLRTWNQLQTVSSIAHDLGQVDAEMYLQKLPDFNRKQINLLGLFIKANGLEATKRQVFRELQETV